MSTVTAVSTRLILTAMSSSALLLADIGYRGCDGPVSCLRTAYRVDNRIVRDRDAQDGWWNDLMWWMLNGHSIGSIRLICEWTLD